MTTMSTITDGPLYHFYVFLEKPDSRPQSDEEVLLQELFGDYNPSARPVIDSSDTVRVEIQFSLMHIKDLVSRHQVMCNKM